MNRFCGINTVFRRKVIPGYCGMLFLKFELEKSFYTSLNVVVNYFLTSIDNGLRNSAK